MADTQTITIEVDARQAVAALALVGAEAAQMRHLARHGRKSWRLAWRIWSMKRRLLWIEAEGAFDGF